MTDPISDMLTRIRNANLVKKNDLLIPFSKIKFEIAKILEKEGFIKRAEKTKGKFDQINIILKYKNKEPVIQYIKRISKPGQRIYYNYRQIPKILPSLGIWIISTSKGLITHDQARKQKIGGELICEIS